MTEITQPKSYSPETVKAGQTWTEKGQDGATFQVVEVGIAGARINYGTTDITVSFQYFAYCNLDAEAEV